MNGQYLRCALCPKLGGALKSTKILQEMGIFSQNNPTYHAANLLSTKDIEIEQNFQYNIFETQLKDINCIFSSSSSPRLRSCLFRTKTSRGMGPHDLSILGS